MMKDLRRQKIKQKGRELKRGLKRKRMLNF